MHDLEPPTEESNVAVTVGILWAAMIPALVLVKVAGLADISWGHVILAGAAPSIIGAGGLALFMLTSLLAHHLTGGDD
jgi:hypothetical protein